MQLSTSTAVKVAARGSLLSQKQVDEVLSELQEHHPNIEFELEIVKTTGDQDLKTSLRDLDKTDFFTKELDALLLEGRCQITIHSAKDLPDPLPKGIKIIALTRGVDCSDSLVMRPNDSLKPGMLIATSSRKREEAVRKLCSDVDFCDIRGTIQQRLDILAKGDCDGVVIAEAALIRLGLTELNRLILPGQTAAMQGRLAILAQEGDQEMEGLFKPIDQRTRCLYFGIDLPDPPHDTIYTHFPLITTVPRPATEPDIATCLESLKRATHVIFTSKSAVTHFYQIADPSLLNEKTAIATGKKTASKLEEMGAGNILIAETETAEGVAHLIKDLKADQTFLLWPHAAHARKVISSFCKANKYPLVECILYDTHTIPKKKLPELKEFDALFFTSPSTVDAFRALFGKFPKNIELRSIGPITKEAVELYRSLH